MKIPIVRSNMDISRIVPTLLQFTKNDFVSQKYAIFNLTKQLNLSRASPPILFVRLILKVWKEASWQSLKGVEFSSPK